MQSIAGKSEGSLSPNVKRLVRLVAAVALAGFLFQIAGWLTHFHPLPGPAFIAEVPLAGTGPVETPDHDESQCLLCIAAQLAADGAPPPGVTLAVPARLELGTQQIPASAIAARAPFINFLTRAPPAA